MPYYYGFDWTYVYLVLPCLILSLWASARVNSTFKRYSRQLSSRGITGADAAQRVLRANGIGNVRIERIGGNLTDHYDPTTNVIRLSDSVYSANSVAAVGVAAHEAGHAVQYAEGYGPIKVRSALIPLCNIGSQLSILFILIGLVLYSEPLFGIGVILFGVAVLGQLVTLPVEFNASRRAIATLESGNLLGDGELQGAKKVLSAAAMTYVAALLVSLAQLLRFLLAFGGRRRD